MIDADSQGCTLFLYYDNYSGHNFKPGTASFLAKIKKESFILLENATHLIQPFD